MDETGMTYDDKVGLVEETLEIWGEEAAREIADRYEIALAALSRKADGNSRDRA